MYYCIKESLQRAADRLNDKGSGSWDNMVIFSHKIKCKRINLTVLNCDNENLVYGPHEVSVGQARCLGGQMIESCRGLRIFLCLTLVTCWSRHFHVCFTELKSYHLSFFHNEKFCLFVYFVCWFLFFHDFSLSVVNTFSMVVVYSVLFVVVFLFINKCWIVYVASVSSINTLVYLIWQPYLFVRNLCHFVDLCLFALCLSTCVLIFLKLLSLADWVHTKLLVDLCVVA